MLLARLEETLDINQPEEQHGFGKGRRIEEHLLTANVIIDKTFACKSCNRLIWIISLDLSKAFDRVDWDALWDALSSMMHHNTLSGFYRVCITTKSVKFTMLQAQVVSFTSRAVSDKVVFSARDCFARFCKLRSKSGVRVLNTSALILTTI